MSASADAPIEAKTSDWPEVRAWRRAKRIELLSRRSALPAGERRRISALLGAGLRNEFPELCRGCVGFYWPFKGEIDLRPLVRGLCESGVTAALPVVVEKQQPLEFWKWVPRMRLKSGIWDIPIPATRDAVQPTALLVPLIGFDAAGYRLGYGGGYYDRTLAALHPRPLTIGVGLEIGRLDTIRPQPHDIPLDAIVTEAGSWRSPRVTSPADAGDEETSYASPPCYLREVDPAYLGYLSTGETLGLLNRLLEGERAGARALTEMARQNRYAPSVAALCSVARDEAGFCAMLTRHISRMGGKPSGLTGTFYDSLMAEEDPAARLALLNRGQAWVVRKIGEALPRLADDGLRIDLIRMLEVHQRNIRQLS